MGFEGGEVAGDRCCQSRVRSEVRAVTSGTEDGQCMTRSLRAGLNEGQWEGAVQPGERRLDKGI